MSLKNIRVLCATAALCLVSISSYATIVEIRTSLGDIEVNLFDDATPETVENFLSYVNSGAYANVVVHRSVTGFIIQSGGYEYSGSAAAGEVPLDTIETGPAVINEPVYSNLRGTIAMAKLSGSADSATSQWFINLADNSSNLDTQNSGFTVFGQVSDAGMQTADVIASTSTVDLGSAFTDIPMLDYTATDFANDVVIAEENLVVIADVVVTDAAIDTAAFLSPVENTLIDADSSMGGTSSSGGGTFLWLTLLALAGIATRSKSILS
ncbi:peptidylprolyl isomerase [Paraglaciecola marina]|uniref:peptidylprolyl isomerase n=1 Tax=Paraglaciecola marina TaxID=2500157 RepID=UPI00105E477A|nr:peptidylprolyl isomerase [Paraglaciecola marina]